MKTTGTRLRIKYFGLGPVLVAGLLALTLTDILWSRLTTTEKYPDPVAGAIAWNAINKNVDIHALFFLVGAAGALTVLSSCVCHCLAPQGPESETGESICQFLLFSLVPAGWRLAVACTHPVNQVPPLQWLSFFPLVAILVLLMLCRYRDQLQPGDIFVVGGASLLAPLMSAFSALAISLAIARLVPGAVNKIAPYVAHFTSMVTGAAIVGLIAIFILSPTLEILSRRVLTCLNACQYALPLLLFYLLPTPLIDEGHHFRHPYPIGLVVTVAIIGIVGSWRMHRRFRSLGIEINRPLIKAVSPVSVAVISVFVLCSTTVLPMLPNDYFHSGEALLPWQQIWDFHAIPYVDFAPVHGVMEILRGALNQLFFDGSFRNYDEAYVLVSGFAAALTALTLAEIATPLGALFLLLTVLPDMDRMYFVVPPLFIIASPRLLGKPVRWLAVWLILGVLSCAYNPALGPAFVLGTIPVAIWQSYRSLHHQRRGFAVLVAVTLAIGAVVMVIPQIKQAALGFVRFILDNQWTNETANGIAWSQDAWKRDRTYGTGSSQFLWEAVRFGWIPLVLGAAVLYWKQWSKPRPKRSLPLMVLCASVPPVLLWSSLWVIERLDPAIMGRSGTITQISLFALAPALVFLTMPKKHAGLIVLALAVFVGLIYPNDLPTGIDPDSLAQKPASTRIIYPNWRVMDGYAAGLPRLGQVVKLVPDITVDICNLKKDLAQWLKPGETFFDLSNESALYYYLDMSYPVQYPPYVAGNGRMQGVMMRQLEKHPVPVVLIGPCGWMDGVPMSIRCYRPYHDYVLKYAAFEQDGYTFLIDPLRIPAAGAVGSESQLRILDLFFRRENLLRLPLAWGNSWPAMRGRFTSIAAVRAQSMIPEPGHTSSLTWNIPTQASTGAAADFLHFHCDFVFANAESYRIARQNDPTEISDSAEPQLSLTWTSADGTPSAPILFKGQTGDLLIPMGACPRWLLGSGFRTLTLTLQNPRCAKRMIVTGMEFLRLNPM